MIKTDICIIGAGPGGATTALFLAKHGIACTIVDKAIFPRDKICGDALSGKVVEVLRKLDDRLVDQLQSHPASVGSWGVKFIAPNLNELSVPFKKDYKKIERPPGYLSRRMDFDNFLVDQLKKHSNIQLIEGVEMNRFERANGNWRLSNNNGVAVESKMVIAADGAHSIFAREIGKIEVEKKHYCAGIRAYYKGVKGMDKDNFIELHFLKDFLPGYFWIFPLPDGFANVGVGMRSDKVSSKKVNLKKKMLEIIEAYPQLKERFNNAELVDDIRGFGLPLGSRKRKISGEGFMLIGDAASLIDPFTGEGIGNAMISGMLAANQAMKCLKKNDFSSKEISRYDEAVYRRLWTELKLSRQMQSLVNYPWLFNLVVNKANKSPFIREAIMSMFDDVEQRKKLRNPKVYFKLLFNRY